MWSAPIKLEAGEDTIRIAAVDSTTDVALGMVKGTIYHGEIGLVVNTGVITGVDTTSLDINQILYNAGNGSLVSTKPSEEYQACAMVVKQAIDGALLVEFSEPVIDSYKKSDIDTALNLKAEKVQTSTTDTQYVDSTTTTPYKIYIDNGEIIMEEL